MWLLVPVLIGVAAIAFVAFRNARSGRAGSMEDEMRQFRRGLDALDPANDPLRKRALEQEQKRQKSDQKRSVNPPPSR